MQEPSDVKISLKDYYVNPFNIEVHPKDTISIQNPDKEAIEAVVVIPNIKEFADLGEKKNYLERRLIKDSVLTIPIREFPIFGEYTFHIYFVNEKMFLDIPDSSAPKIIIKE